MHTFKSNSKTVNDEKAVYHFHHNGDFSGDVTIATITEEITIPMVDLLEFFHFYLGEIVETIREEGE